MIRLAVPTSDGKISPEAFVLSTNDRQQRPPRLSVFGSSRTTAQQAWEILGRKPKHTIVARIRASRIRSIVPAPNCAPDLDVRWDKIESELPGADGHAGVTGLESAHRRTYRTLLADAANERPEAFAGINIEDEGPDRPSQPELNRP